MGKKRLELLGQIFGRLTVIEFVGIGEKKHTLWLCRCSCKDETEIVVVGNQLTNGSVQSCGCLKIEIAKEKCEKLMNSRAKKRLPEGEPGLNEIFAGYIRHAKDRNLPFELTKEEFKNLIHQNCFYCGSLPANANKRSKFGILFYNGVDRKNNNLGYTLENCVSCCQRCNYAKSNMSVSEFLDWIKSVYEHSILKI